MKLTVLDCVQHILSKMNSDAVNSIGDTVESYQVAQELQSTYYAMIGNMEHDFLKSLIPLEASLDTDRPTHMKVPDNVDQFEYVKYYNVLSSGDYYKEVCYLTPKDFLEKTTGYTNSQHTTVVQDYSGAYIHIMNNKNPHWFTLFDDEHVVFDSYDSAVDDTLQSSKVIAYGMTLPTFELEDDFIPVLPSKYFPQLLAEASMACMWYWKQQQDPIDQQRARQQHVRHFNNETRMKNANNQVPDFGRHR